MKITNSDVIKSGEQELIDAITAELDWGVIEEIFKEKHKLTIEEDIGYKSGDIVAHNDQIAYKLEFEAKVTLSIILDREGNYLSLSTAGSPGEALEKDTEKTDETNEVKKVTTEEDGDVGDAVAEEPDKDQDDAAEGADTLEDEPKGFPENNLAEPSMSPDASPQEKISQMAGQIGDMMVDNDGEE